MNKAILLMVIALPLMASERVRLYDTSKGHQKYTGHAEKQITGDWRFYDKEGNYEGRMTKDRFFSKNGKVLQKYYLIPRGEK